MSHYCPTCQSEHPSSHPLIVVSGKAQVMFCADPYHDRKA